MKAKTPPCEDAPCAVSYEQVKSNAIRMNRGKEIPTLRSKWVKQDARNDATLYAGNKDAVGKVQKIKDIRRRREEAKKVESLVDN